jgi:two-component system chemotaxis response regulator CheB
MYEAAVIGASAGGLTALAKIIPALPKDLVMPIIIVQHRQHDANDFLAKYLDGLAEIHVKEADSREVIRPGCVYIAPAGYHLLVERDKTFSLNIDAPVSYAIPSIDVLFESAAAAYGDKLVGVILTGANSDGSRGLKTIHDYGGLTVVQDPLSAEAGAMPKAAIAILDKVDHIVSLENLGSFLGEVNNDRGKSEDPDCR